MSYRINTFEQYQSEYARSIHEPEAFWDDIASNFHWKKKWNETLIWNFTDPKIEWFKGGKLNITLNALDRHVIDKGNEIAFIWEANDPKAENKSITYKELLAEVCRASNALKDLGTQKGDRVVLYMPMVIESVVAMLACARIGAVHSVVFAGFSSKALADRINDTQAKIVITSDGLNRGNKQVDLKEMVDVALEACNSVKNVLVLEVTKSNPSMKEGRDIWYHQLVPNQVEFCEAEVMDAEDLLFILYTSGSTGKPKGIAHTCGGYMVFAAYSFENVFQYNQGDIYWCTADIGWVTGHTYIVYGPLLTGASSVLFEGIPTYPDAGRFWQVCEKLKVNQFYTAPTAIRSLMCHDLALVDRSNLSQLKTLGTVGEPINAEAWDWYYNHIGKGKCAIVDTWWQTETGGIIMSGLGDITPMKPTYAGHPLPGIQFVLLDTDGKEITQADVEGYLCVKFPWPSMLRSIYRNHERCKQTYFSNYPGYYFTGDGAKRDEQGMYRIIGRVDDVINVSGHRFGTAEIEDAINKNSNVIESAVVGYPHEIKGQGIFAYVILAPHHKDEEQKLIDSINETVTDFIGKIAKPDKIQVVSGLPKTRSGKIMRRILRKIAEGDTTNLGDTSTLLDPGLVDELIANSK
jgi:acetyl-CoA synthetase